MLNKDTPEWLTIAKRQLASLRNEKTIVFAILVQVIVASFSSFLVVGLVSLYSPDGVTTNQQITVGLTGNATEETKPHFEDLDTVRVETFKSYDSAYTAFKDGELNGFVYTRYTSENRISATITAPETGVQSTLFVVRSKRALKTLEQERRTQLADQTNTPILQLEESSQASPYLSYTYTVLIPLLLVLPAFISGSIVSDTIIEDRRNGMIELLRSTPATDADIIRGKITVPLLLGPVQVLAWLFLVDLNGISVQNPFWLVMLGTGFTLAAVGLGAFVTQRTNDRGKAQFVYSAALVAMLSLTTLLPESPLTTIAKLAMNSQTPTTLVLTIGYLTFGLVLYMINLRNFTLDF